MVLEQVIQIDLIVLLGSFAFDGTVDETVGLAGIMSNLCFGIQISRRACYG